MTHRRPLYWDYDAENPAGIELQLGHFFRIDWQTPIFFGVAAGLAIAVSFFNVGLGVVIFLAAALACWRTVWDFQWLFRRGEVCAAQVIDARRDLIAVFTDLSKGSKPCPAISVVRQRSRPVSGNPPRNGMRLAYVAVPYGNPGRSRWRGVAGRPIDWGTTDEATIERLFLSISAQDWQMLERGITSLSLPYQEGTYGDVDVYSAPAQPRILTPSTNADDEPIRVVCTHCRARLKLHNPYAIGRRIECPKCGGAFVASKADADNSAASAENWEQGIATELTALRRTGRRARLFKPRWLRHPGLFPEWTRSSWVTLAGGLVLGVFAWSKGCLDTDDKDRVANRARPAAPPAQAANAPAAANRANLAANPAPAPNAGNPVPNPFPGVWVQPPNLPQFPGNAPAANPGVQDANPVAPGFMPAVPRIAIAIPDDNNRLPGDPFGVRAGWPFRQLNGRQFSGPHVGLPGNARPDIRSPVLPQGFRPGPPFKTPGDNVLAFVERYGKENVLFLDIPGQRLNPQEQQAVVDEMQTILGGHVEMLAQAAGQIPNTTLVFHTDRDVKQVASAIKFAKVLRTDADRRRIILDAATPSIIPKATNVGEPADSPFKANIKVDEKSPPAEESPFKVEK